MPDIATEYCSIVCPHCYTDCKSVAYYIYNDQACSEISYDTTMYPIFYDFGMHPISFNMTIMEVLKCVARSIEGHSELSVLECFK